MKTRLLLASLLGLGLIHPACSADELTDHHTLNPPGDDIFDPGEGGVSGAASGSGTGAGPSTGSSGSGAGGSIDPGPIACDDAQKRCAHEFTYKDKGETSVELRGTFAPDGWEKGVPLKKSGDTWSATVQIPWDTDIQYKLLLDGTTWITDPANPDQVADGVSGFNSLLKGVTCDEWTCDPGLIGTFDWRDAVLYFVFVDRFLDGDVTNNGKLDGVPDAANWSGGDWAGVKQKVEQGYFNDLGVNTLWLSVPMDNTNEIGLGSDGKQYSAYHGYWPSDLTKTEEHFGSLQELKDLVSAAHAKGLKVIVDYAMNHVHKSSPVYQQNPSWFWPLTDQTVTDCICGTPTCDWNGPYGKRCWFSEYLPDFDFTNQAARDFSVNNAVQWIKDSGIDGFRLDAVKHIEDSWLLDLRAKVKTEIEATTKEHFYMVGETFDGNPAVIKEYIDPATKLDGQFDFPLRAKLVASVLMRKGTMSDLDTFLASNDTYYGSAMMSTFLGNHDIPRPIHFAEDTPKWDDEWYGAKDEGWASPPSLPADMTAFERLASAFSVLFTMKGIPLIYYGDEVAMPGAGDPDNRRPMQWDAYSAGQLFVLDRLKKLGTIRAAHPALRKGKRTTVDVTADTLAYSQAYNGDTVYIAINRSDAAKTVANIPAGQYDELITETTQSGESLSVPARSTVILVAK